MHIQHVNINGYKGIKENFEITFSAGMNIIVGENASGKSAIIDALRLILNENEFGNRFIEDTDFYTPFDNPTKSASSIAINCTFAGLSNEEKVAYLPWTISDEKAKLSLLVENKISNRGFYKRKIWGGDAQAAAFEWELFEELINCIYLPPLRDAETKLTEGKHSRLARLLKKTNKKKIQQCRKDNTLHPLEKKVQNFNNGISNDTEGTIFQANEKIKHKLLEAMGGVFGQNTLIQFSESTFNRIVENLRLLFYPQSTPPTSNNFYRSLEENSLGYNNLLYLATILAELTSETDNDSLKLLLIEEPEAHLHPQLQMKLLQYLEETAKKQNVQVIVTTHSPVFSSAISIDSIIHLQRVEDGQSQATSLVSCGLSPESTRFINRWMDVTKSTLLFSKGIIFVEGIAEAMVIPELAKIVINNYQKKCIANKSLPPIKANSLEELGVSVINMNGIYFKHFMQLFCNIESGDFANIPIRCSGITDNDPSNKEDDAKNKIPSKPTPSNPIEGANHALELIPKLEKSKWARLYASPLKTLEYDLAFQEENVISLAKVLHSIWPQTKGEQEGKAPRRDSIRFKLSELSKLSGEKIKNEKVLAEHAYYLLTKIDSNEVGKGFFAQELAYQIGSSMVSLALPTYIEKAILWACGGDPDA